MAVLRDPLCIPSDTNNEFNAIVLLGISMDPYLNVRHRVVVSMHFNQPKLRGRNLKKMAKWVKEKS